MHLSTPNILTFVAAYLLWFIGLCLLLRPAGVLPRQRTWSVVRLCLLSIAGLASPLLLSGCGTAPSPESTRQPVPAALLVPPKKPTLLVPRTPDSSSKTPGPTMPATPKAAPKTDNAFSI